MDKRKLALLLDRVKSGRTSIEEAVDQLKSLPFEDLGFTRIDHHRSLRKGFPEVIWGEDLPQRPSRPRSETFEIDLAIPSPPLRLR
jgi:hypothetical protein